MHHGGEPSKHEKFWLPELSNTYFSYKCIIASYNTETEEEIPPVNWLPC